MNGRKAKLMRVAAGRPKPPAEYEKPELQRVMGLPQYEQHERVIKVWNPQKRQPVLERLGARLRGEAPALGGYDVQSVRKTRFKPDGVTPYRAIMIESLDPETGALRQEPQVEMIPVTKPRRLKAGSARRTYQMLKRLDRRAGGIDNVFKTLLREAQQA